MKWLKTSPRVKTGLKYMKMSKDGSNQNMEPRRRQSINSVKT